jgi:hypothetical protein
MAHGRPMQLRHGQSQFRVECPRYSRLQIDWARYDRCQIDWTWHDRLQIEWPRYDQSRIRIDGEVRQPGPVSRR